jgi:hypothetical protein
MWTAHIINLRVERKRGERGKERGVDRERGERI